MEGATVIGVAVTRASVATPHTHTSASAATPASAASSHLLALQELMRAPNPGSLWGGGAARVRCGASGDVGAVLEASQAAQLAARRAYPRARARAARAAPLLPAG